MLQSALVVQCMGVCLSLQGTQIPSLAREDSTTCIATEPVPQGCRAFTLGPKRCNAWSPPTEGVVHSKRGQHTEKSAPRRGVLATDGENRMVMRETLCAQEDDSEAVERLLWVLAHSQIGSTTQQNMSVVIYGYHFPANQDTAFNGGKNTGVGTY